MDKEDRSIRVEKGLIKKIRQEKKDSKEESKTVRTGREKLNHHNKTKINFLFHICYFTVAINF